MSIAKPIGKSDAPEPGIKRNAAIYSGARKGLSESGCSSARSQLNGKSRIPWFVVYHAVLSAGLQPCSTLTISSLIDGNTGARKPANSDAMNKLCFLILVLPHGVLQTFVVCF